MEENNSQPSKYDAALAKYNTNLNDADIQARVAELIKKKVPENNTEDVKKFLFNCIDLTTLNSTDSDESVMHFTEKVNQFDDEYPDLKNVAAICVYPNFAAIVKNTLEVDGVNIACVSGGFPSSQTFIEVKVAETALAITDGADEIDIVISIGKFLSGDYEGMCEEIVELKEVCKEHHLKVILETGALKSASNIKRASILSMYSGADFIKTSTGKQQPAATPEAAYVKPSRNTIRKQEIKSDSNRQEASIRSTMQLFITPSSRKYWARNGSTTSCSAWVPAVWPISSFRISKAKKSNSSKPQGLH